MDDWISGVGMGFLFFGITVFSVLRRKTGNLVARGQYPALAARLGLKFEPSSYKAGVGRLVGTYQGFQTTVDPDDQRRIYLKFKSSPEVSLHSYGHNKRPMGERRSFRPESRVLSGLFKTAHASDELIGRINQSEELSRQLKPLKFLRELKTLSVTESGIVAVFDYGNPPFIPASVVEDVLPRLASLGRVVENLDRG
jgi:hypothetical protein